MLKLDPARTRALAIYEAEKARRLYWEIRVWAVNYTKKRDIEAYCGVIARLLAEEKSWNMMLKEIK